MSPGARLHAPRALLPEGWARDVLIEIDAAGTILRVTPESPRDPGAETLQGIAVPGMPNLHSHAFQRAMAGLTEARTHPQDSFWTWRELMYRFAAKITPQQAEAIAAHLYVEMLKAGFTAVAEFHYLHHDQGGRPYGEAGEMSQRTIAAAVAAGIAITHLPVLYAYSGFGAQAPGEGQSRFIHSAEGYERLLASLHGAYRDRPNVRIGLAYHSLRAVDPALLAAAHDAMRRIDPAAPIHIHIAEQEKEVQDCIAWSGQRPVAWLLDHMPVDSRWCLVHATHLDDAELRALAASGAVAGVCPSTEANLGDGIFRAEEYLNDRGGAFGIGSDSHVSVSVAEELRLLEYAQRLVKRRRASLASAGEPSPGQRLFTQAARDGARALGLEAGRIAAGARADLVVLDAEHPVLCNKTQAQVLDAWIFAGDAACVRDVMVGGQWRIRERRHRDEAALFQRFRHAQEALLQ